MSNHKSRFTHLRSLMFFLLLMLLFPCYFFCFKIFCPDGPQCAAGPELFLLLIIFYFAVIAVIVNILFLFCIRKELSSLERKILFYITIILGFASIAIISIYYNTYKEKRIGSESMNALAKAHSDKYQRDMEKADKLAAHVLNYYKLHPENFKPEQYYSEFNVTGFEEYCNLTPDCKKIIISIYGDKILPKSGYIYKYQVFPNYKDIVKGENLTREEAKKLEKILVWIEINNVKGEAFSYIEK